MNPLYRFDFDEETGDITRLQIDEYTLQEWSTGNQFYRFKIKQSIKNCYIKRDLETYKSGRVYSFNPDIEHAKEIIKERISIKRIKAHEDYLRYTEIVNKLEGWA